jgi:hypothetical protein
MTVMTKISADWTAFTGAPGFSNHYFQANGLDLNNTERNAAAAAMRTFFNAFASSYPSGLTIRIRSVTQSIDTETGALVGEAPITTVPANVVGTGTGAYNGAGGAVVSWRTGTAVAGRILSGRTFLVPLVNTVYDVDGTLSPTFLTAVQLAAANYITAAPTFGIWHRPKAGAGGAWAGAVSGTVADRSSVLRSRRD